MQALEQAAGDPCGGRKKKIKSECNQNSMALGWFCISMYLQVNRICELLVIIFSQDPSLGLGERRMRDRCGDGIQPSHL